MGLFRSLFDGQHGLIYANVRTYFDARRQGHDHEAALMWMIGSRYPDAEHTRNQALECMEESAHQGDPPEKQLRHVIRLMHTLEVGLPAEWDDYMKFQNEVDEVISQHKRKHPGFL